MILEKLCATKGIPYGTSLTIAQTASLLDVQKTTVTSWCRKRWVDFYMQDGRYVWITWTSFVKYLKEHHRGKL